MNILSGFPPIAADILVLSMVALSGIMLGRVKIFGIRLGVAGVLFSGLAFSHFGLTLNPHVNHFLKEFGLLLFVFTIGLQMGPGFFSSFRKEGIRFNLYAVFVVLCGFLITVIGAKLIGTPVKIASGLFAGATTNTPSLGAAQQALQALPEPGDMVNLASIAYAVAYPFGVIGLILSLLIIKRVFSINIDTENLKFKQATDHSINGLIRKNFIINNPNLHNITIGELPGLKETGVVISRIKKVGEDFVKVANSDIKVEVGDVILAVGTSTNLDKFRLVVGIECQESLMKMPSNISFRRVVLTHNKLIGKTLSELGLEAIYGVTVTRITRQDIVVTAIPDWKLQFGDMLQIVGDEENLARAADALGNSVKLLNETNFAAIFFGIILGILLGMYPINISGLPAPVKLGLAGGPLVIAILLSRIGKIGPFVLHMPVNANTAFRELGILLFLACVGLSAGKDFVNIVFTAQGLKWAMLGITITMVPTLIAGCVARKKDNLNYMAICGILAGSMTDPPALAFASSMAQGDAPAVAYASVYPLTMILRIVSAQLLVLLFM